MDAISERQPFENSEELLKPIKKVIKLENEKDLKIIDNEAWIKYTQLEIDKLQAATNKLNENRHKLELQTEKYRKEIQELDNSININKNLQTIISQALSPLSELNTLQTKPDELSIQWQRTYNVYLEKYKKIRATYEEHHPLNKQLKQLKIEKLKLEVEYKIMHQKMIDEKKSKKQHAEIRRQIFNANIVEFVKAVMEYWKARDLSNEIKRAEAEKEQLAKQLRQLEIDAAKKNKKTLPNISYYNYTPLQLPLKNFSTSKPKLSPECSEISTFQSNRKQLDETLDEIRKRFEQRQNQWCQRNSFSSDKRPPIPSAIINAQKCNLQFPPQKSQNINIISVQTMVNNKKPPNFEQPSSFNPQLDKIKKGVNSNSAELKRTTQESTFAQPPTPKHPRLEIYVNNNNSNYHDTQEKKTIVQQYSSAFPQHLFQQPKKVQEHIKDNDMSKLMSQKHIPLHLPSMSKQGSKENNNADKETFKQKVFTQIQEMKYMLPQDSQQNSTPPSQLTLSLQENSQTQSDFNNTCEASANSQSSVIRNVAGMQLTEQSKTQEKICDVSIATNASTFSQKCQELSNILGKDVTSNLTLSASLTKTSNTSPFFKQPQTIETSQMEKKSTLPDANASFDMETIDELLDDSAAFDILPGNTSCTNDNEVNQLLLSPEYPAETEDADHTYIQPNPNETQPAGNTFAFNFGQSHTQAKENTSFFTNPSNIFNMFR